MTRTVYCTRVTYALHNNGTMTSLRAPKAPQDDTRTYSNGPGPFEVTDKGPRHRFGIEEGRSQTNVQW